LKNRLTVKKWLKYSLPKNINHLGFIEYFALFCLPSCFFTFTFAMLNRIDDYSDETTSVLHTVAGDAAGASGNLCP
jgi:hypothetical protein